jgi:hypothetical protein
MDGDALFDALSCSDPVFRPVVQDVLAFMRSEESITSATVVRIGDVLGHSFSWPLDIAFGTLSGDAIMTDHVVDRSLPRHAWMDARSVDEVRLLALIFEAMHDSIPPASFDEVVAAFGGGSEVIVDWVTSDASATWIRGSYKRPGDMERWFMSRVAGMFPETSWFHLPSFIHSINADAERVLMRGTSGDIVLVAGDFNAGQEQIPEAETGTGATT